MHYSPDLLAAVSKVRKATEALEAARRAVEDDKIGRRTSRWARLMDWLFDTTVEVRLGEAGNAFDLAHQSAIAVAQRWIVTAAKVELADNPVDHQRHSEQMTRVFSAFKRSKQTGEWLALAEDAYDKLQTAASDCSSASSTELLDLVTHSKGISILSAISNDSAASSIRRANIAVTVLEASLTRRTTASDIELPSDMLDLIVDLTFEPAFDILSWLSMGKLHEAERECQRVASAIAPLRTRLRASHATALSKHNAEWLHLKSIEAPYLVKASQQVPPSLMCEVPQGFD
uniref:Uncharacterized protein n=1 Tax=Pseudomonas fluorescens (strain SBW25) TaxID=216595 RepID=A0A0G4E4K1_PSEFS|nr:hypothetical protein [Pseudomonas fluorescens]CEK42094.1 hypothetical protein PQBR57_0141 [Pseudomonas fluorescens SBW25]